MLSLWDLRKASFGHIAENGAPLPEAFFENPFFYQNLLFFIF